MRALPTTLGLLAAAALASQAFAANKAAPPAIAPDLKAAPAPAPAAAPMPDGGAPAAPATASKSAATPDGGAPTAAAPAVKVTDELFDSALTKHFKGDYVKAAAEFFTYIRGSAKTAERYEWAEHFLSMDLDQLGFKQAAIEYEVFVAEERARPEILPDSLTHLEDMMNAGPYPKELVENELLHGTDFGPQPPRPRSFVAYYQGLVDYRIGEPKWGERHFSKVDADSPYMVKVRYLRAVYKLVHDRDEPGAKTEFSAIAEDESAPRKLRNDAYTALARLAYETKHYQESYDLWGKVKLPELDPGRANIYLERAWNLYRMKRYGDAMGLLYAVEAPSFKDVFLPDKYLLRSLIYKDLCHYLPAKRSAREFGRRFSTALKTIKTREPLDSDAKLASASLEIDDDYGDAHRLHAAVTHEKDLIDRYASPWADSGLAKELQRLYGLMQSQTARHEEVARDDALKATADRLLTEEEQLRLEDYEVSLAMYKRLKRGQVVTEPPKPEPVKADEVVYPFDGEYWNDELHDFKLFITSRCLEQEAAK